MKPARFAKRGGKADSFPPLSLVAFKNTSRLIPSKYSIPDESVLAKIAPNQEVLETAFELDNKTNDRLLAEQDLLPGIGPHEMVFGIPYASIINAAFTHARPDGARFSGPDRGAWYAGRTVHVSQAEVAYHQAVALSEVGVFEDEVTYDEYLADFNGEFHDLRRASRFSACLDPSSYIASQTLAEQLLENGSLGVVYPSVRRARGTCLACLDPKSVLNVRKARRFHFIWRGNPAPKIIPSNPEAP